MQVRLRPWSLALATLARFYLPHVNIKYFGSNFEPRLDLGQNVSRSDGLYIASKEDRMSAPVRDKPESLLQAIRRWFRTRSERAGLDLIALTDCEVAHIAEDLSVSTAELYKLARSDARSTDLLKERMAALDLDCGKRGGWCRQRCTICSASAPYAASKSAAHTISHKLPLTPGGRIIAQTSQP